MNPEFLPWLLPYVSADLKCGLSIFHSVLNTFPNRDAWINCTLRNQHFGALFTLLEQLQSRCIRRNFTSAGYLHVMFGYCGVGTYLVDQEGFDWSSIHDDHPYRPNEPRPHRLTLNSWKAKLAELEEIVAKCIWLEQQLCSNHNLGWAKVQPRDDARGWSIVPRFNPSSSYQTIGDRIFFNDLPLVCPCNFLISCYSITTGGQLYCGVWLRCNRYGLDMAELPDAQTPVFWFYPNFVPNQIDPTAAPPTDEAEFIRILNAELELFLNRSVRLT